MEIFLEVSVLQSLTRTELIFILVHEAVAHRHEGKAEGHGGGQGIVLAFSLCWSRKLWSNIWITIRVSHSVQRSDAGHERTVET